MNKQFVFMDGKFIPEEEAVVSVKTHALQYGTGCFEGIRAYFNEKEKCLYAFRLEDHYKRLHASGKILFIPIEYSPKKLCDITVELLKRNFSETDIYIRPFIFKSDFAVGNFNLIKLKSSLAIYTVAMGRYLNVEKGIKANISSWRRISDNSIPPRAKITGSYVNTALAKTESELNGYEEAIFLDGNGYVVEGSGENLFIVKNGTVFTPPASSDILQGITRDTIIKICRNELKLQVIEREIGRSEIYQVDELFLVGTGAEVTPVIEVDKRQIGQGEIGKITKEIKDIYGKLVHGEYPKFKEHLTRIKNE